MNSHPALSKGVDRHRGITEKSKALLFLLREAPYITLADAKRTFYPSHKTLSYAREMIRVLVKNELIARYRMGDGVFIYYLTDTGKRVSEFFLEAKPKFDPDTKSFYYVQRPTKPSEAATFFVFPTRGLDFLSFTPHYLSGHPLIHTRALMELNVRFRESFRFLHVLWLDQVKAKENSLNLKCRPDLLLCNSVKEEAGRVFIEFENSRISEQALLEKIHHLTQHPADWILFLASSEVLLHNLGRLVRKILRGESKANHQTRFFNPKAQTALLHNILFGEWSPSFRPGENAKPFRDTLLYRYDHEIFDSEVWMPGPSKTNASGVEVRTAALQKVTFPSRRAGQRLWTLGEIIDPYKPAFRNALDAAMS
ncbi:MAG: hypothetical protein ABI036_11155 [Fibrobacteria bacterium]